MKRSSLFCRVFTLPYQDCWLCWYLTRCLREPKLRPNSSAFCFLVLVCGCGRRLKEESGCVGSRSWCEASVQANVSTRTLVCWALNDGHPNWSPHRWFRSTFASFLTPKKVFSVQHLHSPVRVFLKSCSPLNLGQLCTIVRGLWN